MITIRTEIMSPTFTKQHVEGLAVPVVFHEFSGTDIDEFYHDHPWAFRSFLVSGWYVEEVLIIEIDGEVLKYQHKKEEGTSHYVGKNIIHKIIEFSPGGCITCVTPLHDGNDNISSFYDDRAYGVYCRQWDETEWRPYEAGT